MTSKNDELREWIDDVREKIINAKSKVSYDGVWVSDEVQAETVQDILDLLFRFDQYINSVEKMKYELGKVRLQDEGNPNHIVKMIIEKIEKGN